MKSRYGHVYRAWKQLLLGRRPALALEITNKCPLSCPGCYAYQPNHVGGAALESVADYQGEELVRRVLNLLDERRPLGLFLVGGEPLVRVRELSTLLPEASSRGIQTEIVTSAAIPIPAQWMEIKGLSIVVSVDGLQPDHDRRRHPATYKRILRHIAGLRVIIHCTVTAQMAGQQGALEQFLAFWGALDEVKTMRISLYTPQIDESSEEMLSATMRQSVVSELSRLGSKTPKLRLSEQMIEAYLNPPRSPDECIFARVTECVSADLSTPVVPCQLGGNPDCSQCGCVATVGLQAIGNHRLPGGIKVGTVLDASEWVGRRLRSPMGRGPGADVTSSEHRLDPRAST